MAKGQINLTVNFKEQGLKKIQQDLTKIMGEASLASKSGNLTPQLEQAAASAKKLNSILHDSWNSALGELDLTKFNSGLKQGFGNMQNLKKEMYSMGQGQAFDQITDKILKQNVHLKQSNKLLNSMAESLKNTVQWSISSTVVNKLSNSIQQAWTYTKKLDSSLNDIRIVTGASADEMERFAKTANKAAKSLGSATLDFTEASLIYRQQGLGEAEANARATTTVKVANVTKQGADQVSEQLTAVWNGYKVNANEAESYIDKLSAVAATTAADLEGLSTGMSKVASAANLMGVDIDQLNASLATVISVTQQAPESVGTAFKTIYARMGDIKAGLNTETTLDEYTAQMKAIAGVDVLNENKELRNMGEVIEEIGNKWSTLSREQQVALSQAMAGTRQYNNLLALFDNWKMYQTAINNSKTATGALQKQQDIYMESTEAHLQKMKTEWEEIYDVMLDQDTMNSFIDFLTLATKGVTNLVKSFGGGMSSWVGIGALGTNLFSGQIARGIGKRQENKKIQETNKSRAELWQQAVQKQSTDMEKDVENWTPAERAKHNALEESIAMYDKLIQASKQYTEEELLNIQEQIQAYQEVQEERYRLKEIHDEMGDTPEKSAAIVGVHIQKKQEELAQLEKEKKDLEDLYKRSLKNDEGIVNNVSYDKYGKKYFKDNDNVKKEKANRKAKKEGQSVSIGQDEIANALAERVEKIEKAKKAIEGLKQEEKDIHNINEGALNILNNQAKYSKENLDIKTKTKITEQQIQNIIQTISLVTAGITQLWGTGKILLDDSVEPMEKIGAIVTTLGTIIPMVVMQWGTLKEGIKDIGEVLVNFSNKGLNATTEEVAHNNTIENIKEEEKAEIEKEKATQAAMTQTAALEEANHQKTMQNIREEKAARGEGMPDLPKSGDTPDAPEVPKGDTPDIPDVPASGTNAVDAVDDAAGAAAKSTEKAAFNLKGFIANAAPFAVAAAFVVAGIVAINLAVKEHNKEMKEAEDAYKTLETAKARVEELKTAYDELNNSYKEFTDGYENLQKMTKGTQEYRDAVQESNKAALELCQTNKELYAFLEKDANGVYTFDKEKTNFKGQTFDEVMEEQEAEIQSAEAMTYMAESNALSKQQTADATKLKRELKGVQADDEFDWKSGLAGVAGLVAGAGLVIATGGTALPAILAATAAGAGGAAAGGGFGYLADSSVDANNELSTEELEKAAIAIAKNGGVVSPEMKDVIQDATGLSEDVIDSMLMDENTEALQELVDTVGANTVAIDANTDAAIQAEMMKDETFRNMSGEEQAVFMKAYGTENMTDEDKAAVETKIDKVMEDTYGDGIFGTGGEDELHEKYADIMGFDSFTNKAGDKAVYRKGTEEVTISDDDARKVVREAISAEQYAAHNEEKKESLLSGITKVSDKSSMSSGSNAMILDMFADSDHKIATDNVTYGQMLELQKSIENGNLEQTINSLTKDEIKAFGYEGNDLDELRKQMLEDIDTAFGTIQSNLDEIQANSLKTMSTGYENSTALRDKITSGEITAENIAEDENWTAMAAAIEEVSLAYPELNAEAKLLNQTALVGTEAWIDAYEQIQNAMADAQYKTALNDVEDAYAELEDLLDDKDIELSVNDEQFQDAMDNILSASYEVDVIIHAQAEDTFEDIESAMDKMSEQASLIGEDYLVAADDVRELGQVFPGILENAKYMTDGTVKLNEELAKSAMEEAKITMEADKEKTISDLEAQKAKLEARKTLYQNLIDLLAAQIEGETTAEEAKQKMIDVATQLKEEAEINSDMVVADSSKVNGEVVAKNWTAAYGQAAAASAEFATAAQTNQDAVAKGGDVTTGDFDFEYSGGQGVSTEVDAIDKFMTDIAENPEEEVLENYLNQMKSQVKAIDGSIADIDGMIAELNAKGFEVNDVLSNIAAGKGAEGKEEILELLDEEFDKYHYINIELQKLSTNLNRVQKAEAKLVGTGLVKALDKELEIIQKQNQTYERKIELMKNDLTTRASELGAQGVTFDSDGFVSNYTEIMAQKMLEMNEAKEKYHNMTESEKEDNEKWMHDIEKNYEDFKEDFENYESLRDEWETLKDEAQDNLDLQIEVQIKKFTADVELKLDTSQAKRDFLNFKKEILDSIEDDDFAKIAQYSLESLKTYLEGGEIQSLTNQVNAITAAIERMKAGQKDSVYGDNIAKAYEDLENYNKKLEDGLQSIKSLTESIEENYLSTIDKIYSEFQEHISQYEYLNDLANHNINLIKLLYGDKTYEDLAIYYEQINQNNLESLEAQRKMVDYAKQMMETEPNPEAAEKWAETYKNALSKLNSFLESSLQNLANEYQNTVNKIFDDLEKKTTNGLGLQYVKEEWDLIRQSSEMYLDTINRTYETQKLENKMKQSLNEMDGVYAQEKLNAVMDEQLTKLKEKENLTKYDVERAEKLYDIALKEIALKEAQNNKSTMRLRRDAQGNYSYQYVADEDKVLQAQQELADAQNSLYNFDKEQYQQNLDAGYQAYANYVEKMKALYADQTLSDEERERYKALYTEEYEKQIMAIEEENYAIRENLIESAGIAFQDMVDTNIDALLNEEVPGWSSAIQTMTDEFDTFIENANESWEQLRVETQNYEDKVDEMTSAAGIDMAEVKRGIDNNTTSTRNLITATDDLMKKWGSEVTEIQKVQTALSALASKYDAVTTAAKNSVSAGYAARIAEESNYTQNVDENGQLVYNATNGTYKSLNDGASTGGGGGGEPPKTPEGPPPPTSISGKSLSKGNGFLYDSSTGYLYDTKGNQLGNLKKSPWKLYDYSQIRRDSNGRFRVVNEDTGLDMAISHTNGKTFYPMVEYLNGKVDPNDIAKTANAGYTTMDYYTDFDDIKKNNKKTFFPGIFNLKDYFPVRSNKARYSETKNKWFYYIKLPEDNIKGWVDANFGAKENLNIWKKYKTGGLADFTGPAWLDGTKSSPELVLNATDTENILTAVSLIRDMDTFLDALKESMLSVMNNLLTVPNNVNNGFEKEKLVVEQQVNIDANFPNVSSGQEVENALLNLVNVASQYSYT